MALKIVFKNRIISVVDEPASKGASKKNGIEKTSVTIETRKEKSRAFNVNRVFFSEIAAKAENTADIKAR